MKKVLLIVLVFAIAMTSTVILTSCPPIDDGPGTTESNELDIWWNLSRARNAEDQALINGAWQDFRDEVLLADAARSEERYGFAPNEITMRLSEGEHNNPTELAIRILGNVAPDIVRMDHVYVSSLGQAGNLLDLVPFGVNEIQDLFLPTAWSASSYRDAVYGVPFDANTAIFAARRSYLTEAGLNIPTTYDEMLEVGRALAARGIDQYAYTTPIGLSHNINWQVFVFMFYVWRLGGDVLNEDNTEAIFNRPDTGVRALEMIKEMMESNILSSTEYQEGHSVMYESGTWRLNAYTEEMEFDLLPELREGVPRYSGLGLYNLAVVGTSNSQNLAYDFVVHFATGQDSLTEEYYQHTFAMTHSLIPSLLTAQESAEFNDPTRQAFWDTSIEQLQLTKYRPPVPQWPDIQQVIWRALVQVIEDDVNPTEALNTAANQVNALLR